MKTITVGQYEALSRKQKDTFIGIVKHVSGAIEYIKNGYLHREEGPAYYSVDSYQEWFFEGDLHRLNGPAIIYPDGRELYFINGKQYTKKDYCNHPEVKFYMIKNSKEFKDLVQFKELDSFEETTTFPKGKGH